MGLMQALGEGVLRLLEEHLLPTSARVIRQVAELAREGRNQEALEVIESDAGLGPALYTDRDLLGARLGERLSGDDPDWATIYVGVLAGALGIAGRREDALAVLEADLGSGSELDYRDRQRVATLLRARLEGLTPEFAIGYLQSYVGVLGMLERHAEGLALLEADLALDDSDEAAIVDAFRRRVQGLIPDMAAVYARTLAGSYSISGREEEAAWVLQAHLGLEELDYLDPDRLRLKVKDRLDSLQPDSAAGLVLFLGMQLDSVGKLPALLALMEGHLDLRPEHYGSVDRLAARLETSLAGLMPVTAANYLLFLCAALSFQGRSADALALFQADAGLVLGEEGDDRGIGAVLKDRLVALPEDVSGTYARAFAATLEEMGRPRAAVALLEGYAGLLPDDYRSVGALAMRLSGLLDSWIGNVGAAFVFQLLYGLLALGESEKAGVLVETYVDTFGRVAHRDEADHSVLPQLVPIYVVWLERFIQDAARRPVEVCRDLVHYLRKNLATQGVRLKDRLDFIGYTGRLRRQIVETGLFWAEREREPEQAKRVALEVQLWDAELMQRLLIERFLLEPILPVPPGAKPTQGWPWSHEIEPPDSPSHLPDPELAGKLSGTLDEGVEAPSPPHLDSGEETRLQKKRPDLFARARAIIRQGVDEGRMAAAIGQGSLLLRASFGSQGRLLWSALLSDGRRTEVVARGASGPGVLARLRWAAARHDFRMAWARFQAEARIPGNVVKVQREVDQALSELLFELQPGGQPQDLSSRIGWISQRFLSPGRRNQKILLRLLIPPCGPLQVAPEAEAYEDWARHGAEQLQNLRDRLSEPAAERLQAELDRITADYLEDIGREWNLDGLSEALSPEVDLVLQVDDVLHTVPVAFLKVAGEAMFRRVRSIRSSLALLMTSLQLETEQEMRQSQGSSERLLSVSYFGEGEPRKAVEGGVWLQHGFSVLAKKYGHETYGAADDPAGSVGLLRTALEGLQRFRVLAICGHGDLFRFGIELAWGAGDESRSCLWEGGGCDLSGVEWLWMVSCSIGRLGQNGDRDVEGFCVRLALHRARSVAAFRWPVHSVQAVALVNESVRLYLESLRSGAGTGLRCLRARALNEARKNFLGDGVNPPLHPHVGLNTAAACELFGLG